MVCDPVKKILSKKNIKIDKYSSNNRQWRDSTGELWFNKQAYIDRNKIRVCPVCKRKVREQNMSGGVCNSCA